MIPAPSLALLICLLSACAEFPQVDRATPAEIPPRPAYLSPEALAEVNARMAEEAQVSGQAAGDALRTRADTLRARSP